MRPQLSAILAVLGLAIAVAPAGAAIFVWVDETGVTHITDDPSAVPPERRDEVVGEGSLYALWSDGVVGPPASTPRGSSGSESDRVLRLLRGAVEDIERGEIARGAATLRGILRSHPERPEPHWYLSLLEQQRGRYEGAERHLRAFLSSAGDEFARWRRAAVLRLAQLADERRLSDPGRERSHLDLVSFESPHFRIELDSELDGVSSDYAPTVLRFLEDARADVSSQIGVVPMEPLGVVFYGKAAYLRAHRHRFSFQTVGFFDGRIHVSAPAHPSRSLRSLLFHEYAHAIFREQTAGDRPYWLNEGLAELTERRSRRLPGSTRTERASLRTRLEAGSWIPLGRLAPRF